MRIGETIRGSISARCNATAKTRGFDVVASMIQGGSKYAAAGIPLPNLLKRVQVEHPEFQRCHVALGSNVVGDSDFELGTGARPGAYVGIRTHKGDLTLNSAEHAEIFHEAHDALRAVLADEVKLHPRDGFWSIWGSLPTINPEGEVRSAEEYQDFMVDQLLCAWRAIENLWDPSGQVRSAGGRHASQQVPVKLSSPNSGAPGDGSQSVTWTYTKLVRPSVDELNQLGINGWELVSVTGVATEAEAWLKKPR